MTVWMTSGKDGNEGSESGSTSHVAISIMLDQARLEDQGKRGRARRSVYR